MCPFCMLCMTNCGQYTCVSELTDCFTVILIAVNVCQLSHICSGPEVPVDVSSDREEPIKVSETHAVNGNRVVPPFPEHLEMAMIGK